MGWEYLLIFIISLVICYAVSPKATQPKPASLSDLELPTAEPGRPISVVFGTRLITSCNTVWYGDLRYSAVETSSGK